MNNLVDMAGFGQIIDSVKATLSKLVGLAHA